MVESPTNSGNFEVDFSQDLLFKVKKTIMFRQVDRVAHVSVRMRTVCVSQLFEKRIPCSFISRLTPLGSKQLELSASRGGTEMYTRILTFNTQAERDDFAHVVRGLSTVGGLSSGLYHRLNRSLYVPLTSNAVKQALEKSGISTSAITGSDVAFTETSFFRCFLELSENLEYDSQVLAEQIEAAFIPRAPTPPDSDGDALLSTPPASRKSSAVGQRGPLFAEPDLLQGEEVRVIENMVSLACKVNSRTSIRLLGTLTLTNYRLVFAAYKSGFIMEGPLMDGVHGLASLEELTKPGPVVWTHGQDARCSIASQRFGRRPEIVFAVVNVPLGLIAKIRCANGASLIVTTSLERDHVFAFDRSDAWTNDFLTKITKESVTPFVLQHWRPPVSPGWMLYDPNREFFFRQKASLAKFCMFDNANYEFESYPAQILVPAAFATVEKMRKVAQFRSRSRVPAVTWIHPTNGAVLARSAQPMAGLMQNRCAEDDELLLALRGDIGAEDARLFVVDARGLPAVAGNQIVRGKGAERPTPQVTLLFMGIDNIHTMRSSYERLSYACSPGAFAEDDGRWMTRLEATGWLAHLRSILVAASRVAEIVHIESSSVLVHCSDGWDRTSQLVSLAQIILDPYYRTVEGLCVLVEKDWAGMGHKFADRCSGRGGEDERAPIFLQFVDCLYQIWRQYPRHFEYTEAFLLALAEAPYLARYGTFVGNCDKDREKIRNCSCSAWDVLAAESAKQYRNSNFEAYPRQLWPGLNLKKIIVWESLHFALDPWGKPLEID